MNRSIENLPRYSSNQEKSQCSPVPSNTQHHPTNPVVISSPQSGLDCVSTKSPENPEAPESVIRISSTLLDTAEALQRVVCRSKVGGLGEVLRKRWNVIGGVGGLCKAREGVGDMVVGAAGMSGFGTVVARSGSTESGQRYL
ncbi:hypothetical protein P692DRAFT_201810672 [Suillus brevipes Sb2]|nr:hypothetical protein P692DRAFT_201810672 [Suillus brevipes Sb2]